MNYYLTTYYSKRLKRLSKQVNLCLYRESQRNQFYDKYQNHDIQILKFS